MKRGQGKRTGGFTLLELLVVVVIIGMLVAYVAPRYFQQIGKSERTAALGQMDALGKALKTYRLDTGNFPSTQMGLAALTTRPDSEDRWNGPYLERPAPADPWGNPYIYRTPGANGDYDLFSYGKDGKPGGEEIDGDLGVGVGGQ